MYLDHGATAFPKPLSVRRAVSRALVCCANPGRGGYRAAVEAMQQVYDCREAAARLFSCRPEQVICTANCTYGLNMAIRTVVKPGSRVLITGFEHNAVLRPLEALGVHYVIAGRKLFDWQDTLKTWEQGLKSGVQAAIFTHVSNVFGYILPVQDMALLCRKYKVPFILDAAQSAGILEVDFSSLGADFIAMPGHKGLLGPQGTGLLLCRGLPEPLMYGGTGSLSQQRQMPDFLPDRGEAGTVNVPGIAGLAAGIRLVQRTGISHILETESRQARRCGEFLQKKGLRVFSGPHQGGTISFVPEEDCEAFAQKLAEHGICVRAGLHCAPLAHESAGTLESGTVRVSFGYDAEDRKTDRLVQILQKII